MTERSSAFPLVVGLGCAQLIAWGALYYAIAVLGAPMREELHVSESAIFGAFAWGLAVSGLLAPWAGRRIDRHGGRTMLAIGAGIGALAFTLIAHASSSIEIVAAWSIAGLAMSLGLYDACFAAIGQAAPLRYRKIVTGVTLFAGFASTVFWPLTHYLLEALDWRAVCQTYALLLLACAPVYLRVLPKVQRASQAPPPPMITTDAPSVDAATHRRMRVLAWAFAGAALIGSAMSAHLPAVLNGLRLADHHAVWIASSIGALQVLGRVLELRFGARLSPARLGLITFGGLASAMLLLVLAASTSLPWLVYGFAILYGIANGLLTIAKATLPVEMLGFANVGAVLGTFSAPSLIARALAPFAFALAVDGASRQSALLGIALVGLVSLTAYASAMRHNDRRGGPSVRPDAR